jgi:hypothetical protein
MQRCPILFIHLDPPFGLLYLGGHLQRGSFLRFILRLVLWCTLLLAAGRALAIALVRTLTLRLGLPTLSRFGLNLKVRLENLVSLWRRVLPAKLIGGRPHEGRS